MTPRPRPFPPALLLEPETEPRGGVLVIHSWWGVTDSFRAYARSLAVAGFRVVVPDLFEGETAATESEARRLRSNPRRRPHYRTLEAGLAQLCEHADLPLAVVGFSMGGHWAVWLSQRNYGLRAAILYYAARAGAFRPGVDYQAHFAAEDPWVSAPARSRMEAAIRRAGCAYAPHDYPGTGHWFAESARPEYAPGPAEEALARDLEFLTAGGRPG